MPHWVHNIGVKPTPRKPYPATVYALEVVRSSAPRWRMGTGTLTECEDALEALADLPMYRGALFVIRRRIHPGLYAEEPVKLLLNTVGIL